MSEQEAAWAALTLQVKQAISNATTREALRDVCASPGYLVLKACENGHFYDQAREAAVKKSQTYTVLP